MTPAVEVRPDESFAEYRAAMRTWRLGWRAAFDDILPASSLPAAGIPEDRLDRLEAVYEDVTANDAVFVAVSAAASGESDSAESVVGFAHAITDSERTESFVPNGDAELKALYVRPGRWGEGTGTDLLEAVESAAAAEAERLVLRTFAENEDGRAFYRARGFEADGEGTYEVDGESYPTVAFAKTVRD